MKKLDIINELRHLQEVSRTTANVLTTIIRQLEKEDKQPEKKGQICGDCGGEMVEKTEEVLIPIRD